MTSVRRDSGSATLEVLILVPVLLALANVGLYAGQVRMLHSLTREAAQAAARQMTMNHSMAGATQTMNATVARIQGGDTDIRCQVVSPANITVVGSAAAPMTAANIGTAESLTVTVSCRFPARLISAPGVGKYITVQESATAFIDPYRWRDSP